MQACRRTARVRKGLKQELEKCDNLVCPVQWVILCPVQKAPSVTSLHSRRAVPSLLMASVCQIELQDLLLAPGLSLSFQ